MDVDSRRQQELISGAGDLLGALLGGRRRSSGLSRAASRRSQTKRTQERLSSAEEKLQDRAEDLSVLEEELTDEVMEITDKWNAFAQNIESVEIPLEKTDVQVASLDLLWLPVP